MRVGVLGGSFDPVHVGHLRLAEAAYEQAGLESVIFVPAGHQWRKADQEMAPAAERCEMVRLAIANASSRELEELRDALQQCEDCGGDPEKFALGDAAFHMALAHCSRNKLMYWLYERISEVRRHAQWRTMKAKLLTPDRIAFYNGQHRRIYEAIAARDTPSAVKLIKQHLYGVHDDLLETE